MYRNLIKPNSIFTPGITFSEKNLLSLAIVFMSVKLNYTILSQLGINILIVIIGSIMMTVGISMVIGNFFKLHQNSALLLGIGNAICGSSAIAASHKILKVKQENIGLTLTIVNLLGTLGFFILPFIGSKLMFLPDLKVGILIGNTLQSVGQVVAAGYSLNDTVGQTATIIKMVRVLMLAPLIFSLIFFMFKNGKREDNQSVGVPNFIIGFILFSMLPTFNLLSQTYIDNLAQLSHYLLIIAMVAIGLKTSFHQILKNGKSAIIVGGLTFISQIIITSIVVKFVL